MSGASRFGDMVSIGVVVKPQGRHGEVAVRPLSDRPHRFPELKNAYLPGPAGTALNTCIESCWPHKGRFVLKFEGVDSIDAAEKLRGQELRIDESALAPLGEGEYYHHQLLGLAVEDRVGNALGRVERLLETGAEAEVLVVVGQGGELLVPLATEFVIRVDLESGRIVVEPPVMADAAHH